MSQTARRPRNSRQPRPAGAFAHRSRPVSRRRPDSHNAASALRGQRPDLALPLGAEEGRAAGLGDAADAFGAIAAGARLALVPIHRPMMLEIPELAIPLHVIAQ